MTRIFHDWEFLEDGVTIKPISCGFVTDSGEEYYAGFNMGVDDTHRVNHHPWLKDNVLPHIIGLSNSFFKSKEQIASELIEFIRSFPDPELWAWYGAYDHVALAQTLGGPMINLPNGIPMFTNDIKTLQILTGVTNPPKQDPVTEHHALFDAMHDRDLFNYYYNQL